jgi:hypothetical protein
MGVTPGTETPEKTDTPEIRPDLTGPPIGAPLIGPGRLGLGSGAGRDAQEAGLGHERADLVVEQVGDVESIGPAAAGRP